MLSALRHRAAELGDGAVLLRADTYGEALAELGAAGAGLRAHVECAPRTSFDARWRAGTVEGDRPDTRVHPAPGRVRRVGR